MPLDGSTQRYLSDFAEYCRKGSGTLVPGLRKDRAEEYRRLTLNIIDDTLQSTFPILRSVLSVDEWYKLVSDFFGNQDLGDPELWKMPRQLLEYALEHELAHRLGRPYINDLLLFEWTETEVFMMPDLPALVEAASGDYWTQPIALNREFRITRFEYPVFKVPASELVREKGDYYLLTFRNPDTLHVQFMELSGVFVEFVQELNESPSSGEQALKFVAAKLELFVDQNLIMATKVFLKSLADLRMILGTERIV